MNTNIDNGWDNAPRLAIGRALVAASRPLCAAELGFAVGDHQSNVKKIADQMVEEGLLIREQPTTATSKPGRTPATYKIASAKRDVEAVLEERAFPGNLSRGQQLVVATVPDAKVADLKRAATVAGPASQVEWIALVDGDPQECFMAFEGERAVDLANDLMAQLAAAEIRCRRATVAQVVLGHRFSPGR